MQCQVVFATALLAVLQLSSTIPVKTTNVTGHSNMDEDFFIRHLEQGDHYQGDILNSKEELEEMFIPGSGMNDEKYRWPDRTVIYKITRKMDPWQTKQLEDAMELIKRRTNCIQFKPRTNQKDYVDIIDGPGCSAAVGRRGNVQNLMLNNDCFNSVGIIAHELVHSIGFGHEQVRSDRDTYITIQKQNLKGDREDLYKRNYEKYNTTYSSNFSIPYDFGSIMHYGLYDFSIDENKLPTITINRGYNPQNITPGQRKDLSALDVAKIRKMYNC